MYHCNICLYLVQARSEEVSLERGGGMGGRGDVQTDIYSGTSVTVFHGGGGGA